MTDEVHDVLLTGCCGYLGAWMTVAMLRAGHRVRGTTQDVAVTQAAFDATFANMPDGDALRERLTLVAAELLDAGSWTGHAEGCDTIVHAACPVVTEVGAPREAMIAPAIEGTAAVLAEARRAGTVRRWVHLSSITALLDHHLPLPGGPRPQTVGPSDWNDSAVPDTDPYAYGKVRGERLARREVAAHLPGADFATVLPGPTLGPRATGTAVPGSVEKTLAPLLDGQLRFGSIALYMGLVDARDVAEVVARVVALSPARLAALTGPARFPCVAQPTATLQDIADAIGAHAPARRARLPRRPLPLPRTLLLPAMRLSLTPEAWSYTRAMLGRRITYDTALTEQTLDATWRPLAGTVADTIDWLDQHGHFPPSGTRRPES